MLQAGFLLSAGQLYVSKAHKSSLPAGWEARSCALLHAQEGLFARCPVTASTSSDYDTPAPRDALTTFAPCSQDRGPGQLDVLQGGGMKALSYLAELVRSPGSSRLLLSKMWGKLMGLKTIPFKPLELKLL